MKKIFALALCLCMLFAFVACGDDDKTQDPAPETPVATTAEYKLGMGVVVNMDESKTNLAQVDATVATVVLDKDGKIVLCRIDVAQNKMNVTGGAIDKTLTFQTKHELGDNYNMAKFGQSMDWNGDGIVKEWYEQAKAFENHVVGMTAAQVEAMATQVVEGAGYVISADDALLTAGCTIQITDFKAAVVKACNDEQGTTFTAVPGSFTLGVAANTTAAESTDTVVKMYSDFACAVVADGKILATLNDAIQPNITINANGEIVEKSYTATKRELKEGYNMSTFGASMDPNGDGRVLEWYVQSAAFSAHVVGMTADQVDNMETATNNIGYQMTTDEALLSAGCTMQITAICDVVAESVRNAR